MKVTQIWSLIVLPEFLLNATVLAVDKNVSKRSAYIVTLENKRLRGYVVQRVTSPNLMSCSHSCLRHAWCTSTNFVPFFENGVKGNCEMIKHEISTINDDNFHDHYGVIFSLHLKGCLMTGCLNGGSCMFNEKTKTSLCSCKLPWTGEYCGVKMELEFNFTALGSIGKQGPTSNAGYEGTSLKNVEVSNGLQEWSAPLTGWYNVELCGASGGDSPLRGLEGGEGARVNGKVYLKEETKLIMLVGQRGTEHPFSPGAGGGGTFVVYSTNSTPLSIAGGGGGTNGGIGGDGGSGQAGEAEGLMLGIVGQSGRLGCVHVDGDDLQWYGGYGGGFSGDGICCNNISCNGTRGKSFLHGGRGGSKLDDEECCDGGFGGGGASSSFTAGGGGGFSGGSVCIYDPDGDNSESGGGGSFVPDNTWYAETGACSKGDGYVTFRFLG